MLLPKHQFVPAAWAQLNPNRLDLTKRSDTDHSRSYSELQKRIYSGFWNFNVDVLGST